MATAKTARLWARFSADALKMLHAMEQARGGKHNRTAIFERMIREAHRKWKNGQKE